MYKITETKVQNFISELTESEKQKNTKNKYKADVKEFIIWNDKKLINKQRIIEYKNYLVEKGLKISTVNGKLISINYFLKTANWKECCISGIKQQKSLFRSESKELTKEEYYCLVDKAYALGKERIGLLIETICSTGIRVSELKFITVEMVKYGIGNIYLKRKCREIIIPKDLKTKLLKYASKHDISSGAIFITRTGKSLDRRYIWSEMKKLCESTDIESTKVFPHNLRHLYAVTYYYECSDKDLTGLACLMGHSNTSTTMIYTSTYEGRIIRKNIEKMQLVRL